MERNNEIDKKVNTGQCASNELDKEMEEQPTDPTLDECSGSSCNQPLKIPTTKNSESDSERNVILSKMNVLQEKTKALRKKISNGFAAKRLQEQEKMIRESSDALRENDAQAALYMNKRFVRTLLRQPPQSEVHSTSEASLCENNYYGCDPTPSTNRQDIQPTQQQLLKSKPTAPDRKDNDTSSICSTKLTVNLQDNQLVQQQQLSINGEKDKTKQRRRTRRELEEQLQNICDLMKQLMLQNPQVESNVRQMIRTNKKFKNLDLLSSVIDAKGSSFLQDGNCRMPPITNHFSLMHLQKQRQDSISSNSNSMNSLLSSVYPSTSTKNQSKPKKRRKKNKSGKKTQKTEYEALLKYLKAIVQESLGDKVAKEKVLEYIYKPEEEDLEAYAQRLVEAGMGQILQEEIRVNRKNNRQSFIMVSADRESTEHDGIILAPVARQYAFDGDVVRAFVMNPTTPANNSDIEHKQKKEETAKASVECGNEQSCSEQENLFCDEIESDIEGNDLDVTSVSASKACPKAFVIDIVKKVGKREVVGNVSFKTVATLSDGQNYYKMRPHDMRMPMIYIPLDSCGDQVTSEQKKDVCGFLYVVHVLETNADGNCIGKLAQPVGKVGDLEAEITAILMHNDLKDVQPYEDRFDEMFTQPDPPLTASDLNQRMDLRKKCIFTIDPITAKDLDDAVSIELMQDGLYEVGVHISDVAFYLQEDTELDNIVKLRATSIYLVNEVIHMLPKTLCFKCSLLPGEDKFAFSVFWRMNENGDVIGQPIFTRSIINSCTQFAYEHAQKIIENPEETFDADDFPAICNEFTTASITSRVLALNAIAKKLRAKRYNNGAISINNPKLRFNIDPIKGEPLSYEVEERVDANFLIEEFMLLANQSVARFIYDHFPQIAILRNHAAPLAKSMKSLKEKLANLGIDLDCSSSKAIYESIQRICSTAENPRAMDACLSTLLTKPMARAKYFCSENVTKESDLWHYALSIPIYTHFTSPIRRYPDILVHRILAAALDYCPPPKRSADELHQLAVICNNQKFNAKNAGDESINLFFKRYIKSKQSITLKAVIIDIFRYSMNVVTIETGHALSIEYKLQKVIVDTSNWHKHILISEKNSKCTPLQLEMFSTVDIKLAVWDGKISGFFASPDPKQRQLNSIIACKKARNDDAPSCSYSTSNSSEHLSDKPKRKSKQVDVATFVAQGFKKKLPKKGVINAKCVS